MGVSMLMIVLALSSLEVSFPWYLWIIGLLDVLLMIVNDHKIWLKEQQQDIRNDIKLLEEHRGKLITECVKLEKTLEDPKKQ